MELKKRFLEIDISENNAFFLWGARKVGKTTYLKKRFPEAKFFDLLNTQLKTKMTLFPHLLREEVVANAYSLVVIDEVQKVPQLLDEVHWCLENTPTKFILCGSSARKLRHGAANLLGGRAWRYEMFPLTSEEIVDIDLVKALNHGTIPQHYSSANPVHFLESYVLDYIDQEIQAEALVRNIAGFGRFLEGVAVTNAELINYENIARECGVSAKTIREYYQILEDTLLGYKLLPWHKRKVKPLIESSKFYMFDTGLIRALHNMSVIQPKTTEFGKAFENFLINEIRAYLSYTKTYKKISFWRTRTHEEIDLIVGDMEVAIEFKAKEQISGADIKAFDVLYKEFIPQKNIVVSLDPVRRQFPNGVVVMPWAVFLKELWQGLLF